MCCKKHEKDNNTQTSPDNKKQFNLTNEKKQTSFLDSKNTNNKNEDHDNVIDDDDNKSHTTNENLDDGLNEYTIDPELEAILARLVSDYRAIFAIEDEIHHGTPHGHTPCMSPHCQYCHSYQDGHK